MRRLYPSFATFLACTYGVLILYASLYPFSGWQTSGLPLFDFLSAPWPRDRRPDDLISNILGYIPLGFLITMALRHHCRRVTAALLAVLITASLSFSVEFLQNLLPSRVASNIDLGSNALGGALGALIGIFTPTHLLGRRGRLHRLRWTHVLPGRGGELGLILVALWLIAQAQPLEAPFNGGMLSEHFDWSSPLEFSAAAFMRIEAFTVACSCLATGFFVMILVHTRPLAASYAVLACGLLIKSAATWLFLVPGDALGWITPGSLAGIACSLLLLALATWLPARGWRPLAVLFLILMVAGSNLLPSTPYDVFGPSLARRGNGINFLGMANGLALLWPLLALTFLASLRWSGGYRTPPRRIIFGRTPIAARSAPMSSTSSSSPTPTPSSSAGSTDSYFRHHVFFCCNQRAAGETCCNDHKATEMQTYAKDRIAALGLKGRGKIRINKAGCLDRCDDGPVLVVYPDNVWYTYVDQEDIEEIIQEHLVHGRIVARLRLPEGTES